MRICMKAKAIQLLSSAGLFGPAVVVPVILKDQLGASTELIGIIAGSFATASFLSNYFFGRASDVYGRRVILLAGLLMSGFATILQAVSVHVGGLAFFAVARVLIGFASGIFPAALLSYAYHETKGGKMGSFAAYGAGGWGLGNLAIGLFGMLYEQAYLLCCVIIFVSFAIAFGLPFSREPKMAIPLFPKALIRKNAPVYAAVLIRHTGASMIWVTYPLFLISIGASNQMVGGIYAINSFGQFAFMTLMDRFKPKVLVTVGLGSSALTFFTFTLVNNWFMIIPSQLLLAAAYSSLYVGSLRYVMDKNEEKATVSGLLNSTLSISGIIGPVLGGIAATLFDFKGAIIIATIMATVALGIFLFALSRSGELYPLGMLSRNRT